MRTRKVRPPLLLTDVELDLMQCVWAGKKVPAGKVQLQLVRQGKETAYTTVKTMLDRLVKVGVAGARVQNRRYVYYPKVLQKDVANAWYRHLNQKIFGK